ncbi:MAG: prephenate dehydrogenase [Flavobacteriaceae bacterium]|jgi:prephenate dehydrogenase|nr:prephenate dehydrogenase [Flavobacteriaceae bacterium]MDC3300949.1 prephenate dehydrogenase [Flavobacteriaceae bacterium]MDC3300963.1 prephenate dehydrogenase [Flavobacteriaceae bacterium]
MKNIYIIGTGLIGGSLALNLKAVKPKAVIHGIDHNEAHLTEALNLGLIHKKAVVEDIEHADLVLLSIPVNATLNLLPRILDLLPPQGLVVDMGSTKASICQVADAHPKRAQFLANHPIAGTEFSGPKAAFVGLFKNKTNIICDLDKTEPKRSKEMIEIFKAMGMSIRYMDAVEHDKHIAYVSHLSHISSFMLGKTVIEKEKNELNIFDMAGSGFESTVRLAKSSPDMWAPIFEQNKENVIETLNEYIQNLNHFKALMESDDFESVRNEMRSINHIKTILKGIS